MNISILSNLFNKSGGPMGTGGCSDEDMKAGKCDMGLNYGPTRSSITGETPGVNQSASYFPGASVHKGALYAHKARHKIR